MLAVAGQKPNSQPLGTDANESDRGHAGLERQATRGIEGIMRRPSPNAICYLCVIAGLAIGYAAKTIDSQINGMSAVGGREEYERQRAKHLDRLRRNEHVKDKAVRERDAAAIEAEIDELGRDFPVQEWGEELRRVK